LRGLRRRRERHPVGRWHPGIRWEFLIRRLIPAPGDLFLRASRLQALIAADFRPSAALVAPSDSLYTPAHDGEDLSGQLPLQAHPIRGRPRPPEGHRKVAELAPGTTLVLSFLLPLKLTDPRVRPGVQQAEAGARASGTPFVSFFTPVEMLTLAREAGFREAHHVSAAALTQCYFAGRTEAFVHRIIQRNCWSRPPRGVWTTPGRLAPRAYVVDR
jgi:hypothetical protein